MNIALVSAICVNKTIDDLGCLSLTLFIHCDANLHTELVAQNNKRCILYRPGVLRSCSIKKLKTHFEIIKNRR